MSAFCIFLGFAGLATNLIWPFLKGRGWILAWQGIGALFFMGHFATMPNAPATEYIAAKFLLIAALQCFAAIPFERFPAFRWVYLLTIPLIIFLFAQGNYESTMKQIAALTSLIGMGLQCWSRFTLDVMRLRWLFLFSLPLWMAHNSLTQAWPALTSDIITTITCIIGLRLALREQNKSQSIESSV